jgi:hypothetical protein
MATQILTQDQLKTLLDYNPDTGEFTWRVKQGPKIKEGKKAGTTRPDGYQKININYTQYYSHRLAWLYMTGELTADIDHIDRDPSNNRFSNLRAVTKSQNQHNRVKQCNNTSGYKGVIYFKPTGKWRANIWVKGKNNYLGYFDTPEEANRAYQKAAAIFHSHRPGD